MARELNQGPGRRILAGLATLALLNGFILAGAVVWPGPQWAASLLESRISAAGFEVRERGEVAIQPLGLQMRDYVLEREGLTLSIPMARLACRPWRILSGDFGLLVVPEPVITLSSARRAGRSGEPEDSRLPEVAEAPLPDHLQGIDLKEGGEAIWQRWEEAAFGLLAGVESFSLLSSGRIRWETTAEALIEARFSLSGVIREADLFLQFEMEMSPTGQEETTEPSGRLGVNLTAQSRGRECLLHLESDARLQPLRPLVVALLQGWAEEVPFLSGAFQGDLQLHYTGGKDAGVVGPALVGEHSVSLAGLDTEGVLAGSGREIWARMDQADLFSWFRLTPGGVFLPVGEMRLRGFSAGSGPYTGQASVLRLALSGEEPGLRLEVRDLVAAEGAERSLSGRLDVTAEAEESDADSPEESLLGHLRSIRNGRWSGQAALETIRLGGGLRFGEVKFEASSGPFGAGKSPEVAFDLSAESGSAGRLEFGQMEAAAVYRPEAGQLDLSGFSTQALGGALALRPVTLDFGQDAWPLTLLLESVELQALADLIPQFDAQAQGAVSGKVTVMVSREEGIWALGGELGLDAVADADSASGRIRYVNPGWLTGGGEEVDERRQLVEEAFENLGLETLAVEVVEPRDDVTRLLLRIRGRPQNRQLPESVINYELDFSAKLPDILGIQELFRKAQF